MLLILDIDGTIADHSHRVPILNEPGLMEDNFKRFLDPMLVDGDQPFPIAQMALESILPRMEYCFFVTGRSECLREITVAWLDRHFNVKPTHDSLFMRPDGELSRASEHKESVLISKVLSKFPNNVDALFIDDDPFVLSFYSQYGLTLKAPECWDLLIHEVPVGVEPLFNK